MTSMSKVQKKKRVARVNGDAARDGISTGCLDLLSNIEKNMENNFPTTVQSNTSKLGPKNSEHKDAKESPSNSKEYTQNTSKISSKRSGLSRKFPLMEKTQKTLMQIKHNQSIPKPRAHLKTLSEPLSKRKNPRNSLGNRTQNGRNKHSWKSKKKRSVLQSENSAGIKDKNIPQNKKSSNFNNFYESEENSQQTITGRCSKTSKVSYKKSIDKSEVKKRHNYRGTCSENDTSMNVVDDSNGDTADDEYEKFIKKNKKLLKNKLKTKNSMKSDRNARKNTILNKKPKFSNSDSSDDTFYHKTNSLKISKNKTKTLKNTVHRKISNLNDSDSSDDILYHKTHKINWLKVGKDCEIETQGSKSDTDLVNLETFRDTSETDIEDFTQQLQDLTDSEFVEQNKNCLAAESQLLSVTNDLPDTWSEQNNLSDKSLICDTAVSDNCKSMSHDFNMLSSSKEEDDNVINTAQTDHDESDIEIIDIIVVPKTKSKKVRNDLVNTNLNKANSQSFVENKEKYKIDFITDKYNDEIESKVNILKQSTIDNLNVSEVPVSLNKNKLFCGIKEEDSDDDIIFEFAVPGKNEKCASAASNEFRVHGETTVIKTETPKSFISNKIPSDKTENSFNLIGVSKGDSSSYSNSETCSKNEDVSLKVLKLYEVACSNLAHTANLSDKMLDKLKSPEEPIKEKDKHLVETLKGELKVYQDIVQVKASLKLFETRQVERVQSIRSQILESMGKQQYDNLNSREQINLLYKTEKMSNAETSSNVISEDLKDVLQKTTGMTRLLQDESPIHSRTIVLPSPVVDKDVKPDLSLLDDIPLISAFAYDYSLLRPKSEPISVHDLPKTSTRNSFTLATFGEKCNLCGKEAVAACQRCAKVFFCSNECGKKFWQDGHENECGK